MQSNQAIRWTYNSSWIYGVEGESFTLSTSIKSADIIVARDDPMTYPASFSGSNGCCLILPNPSITQKSSTNNDQKGITAR